MTHEELLIEINRRLEVALYNGDAQSIHALRAVVELHKPMLWKNVDTDKYGYKCQACQGWTRELYPCPTIQAIEKELL
jgi:hypothetical protein